MLLTEMQAAGIQLVSHDWKHIVYDRFYSNVVRHEKEMLK